MAKIKATIKKDSPVSDIIKAAKAEKQAFKEAVELGNSKQQTAVEWLIDQLRQLSHSLEAHLGMGDIRVTQGMIDDLEEQAKQMEKEQLENARPQIISNCVIKEIADEDIKRKIKKEYNYTHYEDRLWMVQGAVWYKEQLKKQQ